MLVAALVALTCSAAVIARMRARAEVWHTLAGRPGEKGP